MGASVPNIDSVGQKAWPALAETLRREVAQLLGRNNNTNFPGAQPISFARKHLGELRTKDYFVCEKSDGIRCLLWFTRDTSGDSPSLEELHCLIDRKNNYYRVQDLHFPRPAASEDDEIDFGSFHYDTILDGELLWDKYPDGSTALKYLVFDCLVLDGQNLTARTLDKRLGHFRDGILAPYKELWKRFPEDCREKFVFRMEEKSTQRHYGMEMMFREILPGLKHGSDGLIFTCRETPYKSGTDQHILKWKPAEENTIDFKLDLAFPSMDDNMDVDRDRINGALKDDHQPDYNAMPTFNIYIFGGEGKEDQEYGRMHVEPGEWEIMKAWAVEHDDGLDGQIVECYKDKEDRWRFNRFRDDKTEANHYTVADKVLESIEDAVSAQDLKDAAYPWRNGWKAREAAEKQTRKEI